MYIVVFGGVAAPRERERQGKGDRDPSREQGTKKRSSRARNTSDTRQSTARPQLQAVEGRKAAALGTDGAMIRRQNAEESKAGKAS